MKTFRILGPFTVIVLLAGFLAACSGITTNQGTTTTTTKQSTTAMTTTTKKTGTTAAKVTTTMNGNMDGGTTTQGIAIAPDTAGMNALIRTGKATIDGAKVSVLLTNKDFAVYTYKADTAFKATCTGACAKDWPPVLAPQGTMTVSSSVTLLKPLTVHQTTNGAQVFYDGHALYTYAADTKAGSAMGHGQDMQWYLVAAMLSNMATTTGTVPATNNIMMQGITVTPAMASNMGAFIHTGKAAINGNQVNVLLTNKNFAMYYYKSDTAFKATCTGACAKDWPPVLAPMGMMAVSSSMTLPRHLSVLQTANGAQVFYDGHALYTYAADKQANNAQGRGQDMLWYMVGFLL
jgi:predicted lipoprotein with Yx(FWY)xxD motif